MSESKNNYIGALWVKEAKNGNKFMSGTIELDGIGKVPITIFKNNRKEKPNHPDYNILLNNYNKETAATSPVDTPATGPDEMPW